VAGVRCSARLGDSGRPGREDLAPASPPAGNGPSNPQNTRPNTQPSTKKNANSDAANRFETSRHR